MKAYCPAMLSLLLVSFSPAQLPYTKKQAVAYAKPIDVQMLGPFFALATAERAAACSHRQLDSVADLRSQGGRSSVSEWRVAHLREGFVLP